MITQEDIDAMEDGMGLVDRLRQLDRGWPTILSTAADRIEQLERDLAEQVNKKVGYYNDWIAEKALADRLALELEHSGVLASLGLIEYRKARGL